MTFRRRKKQTSPHRVTSFALACISLLLPTSQIIAADAAPVRINQKVLVPFIKKHCLYCHGPDEQEGDFSFDKIHWAVTDNNVAQDWQDVLDVLNGGEMPPKDEPQPNDQVFKAALASLTADLDLARKRLAQQNGEYTIRRINKREYSNTIKHLFGLNIDASLIPDDVVSENFDTQESDQYFDGPLFDQYLRIGTLIAEEGLKWSARPYEKVTTKRTEAERSSKKSPYPDRPKSKEGFYLHASYRDRDNISSTMGNDPRASYRMKIRAGIVDKKEVTRHYITVRSNDQAVGKPTNLRGVLKVRGTIEKPSIEEIVITRNALGREKRQSITLGEPELVGITNPSRWFPIYLRTIGYNNDNPSIWIDWTEIEGPLYDSKSNTFGTLISSSGENLRTKEKAKELIEKFAFEAFRRVKPDSSYVNKLVSYFNSRLSEGVKYDKAMAETIGIILASPNFLYLEESQQGSRNQLSQHGFANRLSYFLWSAPPDEQLYKIANSNALSKEDALKKQINLMLNDPKADSFYDGFMSQWLRLDRLADISVNWQDFNSHNDGIKYGTYREPIEFFKVLVRENLNVNKLIDSEFMVVNHQMSNFYGVPSKSSSNDFVKVPLPKGHARGGIITQSAFLTIGSTGDRTSPVIRGTMIMSKLLNNPPPPPPPNVPELGAASKKPISNRQLVERHRAQRVCASCHDRIDPIGFGLENFDSIGVWREHEIVGDKEVRIKASSTLASGQKFNDLTGLQKLLNTQKHKLARNIVESLIAYSIGRQVEFSDKQDVDDIMKRVEQSDYSMQDMIFEVANSKTFRSK